MRMERKQFRIGQLAEHLGVEKFVVRFWEKEFNLSSQRSNGGQRFYNQTDLKKFKTIKKLLYEEGFTIAGAKKQLKNNTDIIASQKTTLEACQEQHIDDCFVKKLHALKKDILQLKKELNI